MPGTSQNLKIAIRPVEKEDRSRIANLMHFEHYVHRHLDWISPIEMMDARPFLVVEQDGQVQAALACPIDPPGVAWLRLFVASDAVSYVAMWQLLWSEAQRQLPKFGEIRVVAIALRNWMSELLKMSKFIQIQNVVFLTWEAPSSVRFEPQSTVTVRAMTQDDLLAVSEVDQAAFGPIWRNSLSSLVAAFEQSYIATVAEIHHRIIGYQISTVGPMGGHLARLAVHPDWQGRKIGSTLLLDVLRKFYESKIYKVSVNTQQDNTISLHLYHKLGFRSTGESYGVYEATRGAFKEIIGQ